MAMLNQLQISKIQITKTGGGDLHLVGNNNAA